MVGEVGHYQVASANVYRIHYNGVVAAFLHCAEEHCVFLCIVWKATQMNHIELNFTIIHFLFLERRTKN